MSALLLASKDKKQISKDNSDVVAKLGRSKQQHLFIIQWIHQVLKKQKTTTSEVQ